MSEIMGWCHYYRNTPKKTPFFHKSFDTLTSKLGVVNVKIHTLGGKKFMTICWRKRDGSLKAAHIFECPPVFVNGQIIYWSEDIFQGIENYRHTAPDKGIQRSIEIFDSNYFNELLLAHINQ